MCLLDVDVLHCTLRSGTGGLGDGTAGHTAGAGAGAGAGAAPSDKRKMAGPGLGRKIIYSFIKPSDVHVETSIPLTFGTIHILSLNDE